MRKLWSVVKNECRHMLRDPLSLSLVTVGAMLVMAVMAYDFSVDIQHVPAVVLDYDHSPWSRAFLDALRADPFFSLRFRAQDQTEIETLLRTGRAKVAVIIPEGFEDDIHRGQTAGVQILVDGSESNVAHRIVGHAQAITENFSAGLLLDVLERAGLPQGENLSTLELRTRVRYNPGLKVVDSFVPGLMGIVLAIPALAMALSVAKEQEMGTLEALICTPLGRSQILIGKMVPHLLLGLVDVLLLTVVGHRGFGVPFRGSLGLFLGLSTVFLLANLGIGILVATFVQSQAAAMTIAFMYFIVPPFFLSGLFLPLSGMPAWLQKVSFSLPATHFVTIARGVFLKGVGLQALWPDAAFLLALGLVLNGLATARFRNRLA
ncbi:MAG: ABC transporter permease [Anaerolineae bacterium]